MALKHWKKLNQKIVLSNDHWSYNLDEFEIDNGHKGEYHYVHTLGSSMVIPLTGRGTVLMVNQFRYLNQKEGLEFPCGAVEVGLEVIENARKELREETGYSAKELFKTGEFAPYTGASDETCTVFLARGLVKAPLQCDITEEFEVVEKTFEEVEALIENNTVWDGLTLAAWAISRKYIAFSESCLNPDNPGNHVNQGSDNLF